MLDLLKYTDLKLAAQKALLGEVVNTLRGVAIDWADNNTILLYLYNDGEITNDLKDFFMSISTDIVANFNDAMIDDKIIRLDYPQSLPFQKHWVYKRKE